MNSRITLHPSGDQFHVDVTDDGPGVPVELAMHVFDRRVSGSNGTGIGLALARSLAAAEGGQLDLVQGGGSRFRLSLPADPRD